MTVLFCELDELAKEKRWEPPAQNMLCVNVALSDRTGFLNFSDPGNEGGKQLGGNDEEVLSLMTAGIYANVTKCGVSKESKHTIDQNRITVVVPTHYTMNLFVSSLQGLNLVQPNADATQRAPMSMFCWAPSRYSRKSTSPL
jgi:hypothetical protein